MKTISALKRVSSLALSLLVLAFVLVWAAAAKPALAESGQAFSISPPLLELKADPGQTVIAKIKLTNVSGGELLIKTQLNDFGAKNETGEPNIIFEDDQSSAAHSLRQWISSPAPFKLASQESKTLEIPITPPADAEPGGHYAVIRFTGMAPELEQSGVALSASIGSLVLMQVSGAVNKNASAIEFYSANTSGDKNGFFENGPVMFSLRIKNDGNVHVKPTGTLDIYNTFGQKVDTLRVNGDPNDPKNTPKSALPNSIRRFDTTWDQGWGFGQYRAVANISYGDGKTIHEEITFWMIPYKLIIGILILGAALFFGLRLGIKRYNQHIIAKATGQKSAAKPQKLQINKRSKR